MAAVLVVDDEPDIRYLTQINLELDGHTVMTAANGTEAVAAVKVELPDLILCDVMMPDLDGWGVLEQLKADADPAVAEIPVLMLTALGSDDDQIRGAIEGAVRYLVKPVSPEDLREAVNDALASGPEPEQRRRAQTQALEQLARKETGNEADDAPRPKITRLEHVREGVAPEPARPAAAHADLDSLTDKQRELLTVLHDEDTVSAAANRLGVSRSNVYASLRRINRKLDVASVQELLHLLRSGRLLGD